MTEKRKKKHGRLSYEILGLIGIGALLAVVLFVLLTTVASAIVEVYCYQNDVVMTEYEWMTLDRWVYGLSMLISACFFSLFFLFLLGDRLAYIRKLTHGIEMLRNGDEDSQIPLEGNNELTELAGAINEMSAARRQLRDKERELSREKEQLIRTLSHDIRTPLTSILAYSDYLAGKEELDTEECRRYLELVEKKALQIRDMTDILLDGGRRNAEQFADARLLMEQLAAEFEEELEDVFTVRTDLTACPPFSGTFDVQDLRRIMDNLITNVRKYAAPDCPVELRIGVEDGALVIAQRNAVGHVDAAAESYQLGLRSIRRIAQHYAGQVAVEQDEGIFSITITLSEF